MHSLLREIVAASKELSKLRQASVSRNELLAIGKGRDGARSLKDALLTQGISIIAEFKRAAPSTGDIDLNATAAEVAAAYEEGGASAMSVLTEPTYFKGNVEYLREARNACQMPILRKDFITERYQVTEAWAYGADAILLIAAALTDDDVKVLVGEAQSLGLEVLFEVHDEQEALRANQLGLEIVGVNQRDLNDFTINYQLAGALAKFLEAEVVVAESGIRNASDISQLRGGDVNAALVGSSLMKSKDKTSSVKRLVEAGT